jgi:hypothetical protein
MVAINSLDDALLSAGLQVHFANEEGPGPEAMVRK